MGNKHLKYNAKSKSYEFQRRAPNDIVPMLGGTKWWRVYLGTDRKRAELEHDQWVATSSVLFARLRAFPANVKQIVVERGGLKLAHQDLISLDAEARLMMLIADDWERDALASTDTREARADAFLSAAEARQTAKKRSAELASLASLSAALGAPTGAAKGSILWHLDRWTKEKTGQVTTSHVKRTQIAVKDLVRSLGTDKQAATVTKADIKAWKGSVHRLAILRIFFGWLVTEDAITNNPTRGVRSDGPKIGHAAKVAQRKQPFSGAELARIIAHFDVVGGEAKWIVRLLIYSGARVEEVLQLCRDDVREVDGVWAVDIHDRVGHVKGPASVRLLPIHHDVVDAGFTSYIQSVPPGSSLWPGMVSRGYRQSDKFVHRFSKALRRDIKITDKRRTLHSTRHSFITAAARADLPGAIERELTGHAKGFDVHARTYTHNSRMTVLRDWLGKVDPLAL